LLIKIKNKKQNKFIVSEKLYIGITDTINSFRSTLACCEESCRNPEESTGIRTKYRTSCPAGIPAKNSCDGVQKPEFLGPLQNHVPMKNSSGKHRKKKSQESCFFSVFDPQTMNS
jgi:hypothetical protein